MILVALLAGALIIPCVLYAYASSPLAWGMIRDGKIRLRGGGYRAYREAPQIRWVEGHAPPLVRVAAFTSFCLGQMLVPAVPGALLWILIAVATWLDGTPEPLLIGLALASPTGIIVAARVLGAGLGLLQRAPHAAELARSAAWWELGHHLALSVFLLVLFMSSHGSDNGEVQAMSGLLAALCLVTILHAGLLFWAANALDGYNAAAEVAQPVEVSA